jgi:hypothetical protein
MLRKILSEDSRCLDRDSSRVSPAIIILPRNLMLGTQSVLYLELFEKLKHGATNTSVQTLFSISFPPVSDRLSVPCYL